MVSRGRTFSYLPGTSPSAPRRFRPVKQRVILAFISEIARRAGVDIRHYRPVAQRRMTLLRHGEISTVLDVGANIGQYATELRDWGYDGKIESFEPAPAVFAQLSDRAAADPIWNCYSFALGDYDGEARLNVTARAASSSLRRVASDYSIRDKDSVTVDLLSVPVRRLDGLDLKLPERGTLLKLDVQGYEDAVLRGATVTLERVSLIECELSVRMMYENQPLLPDMLELLGQAGFQLTALNPGYYDVRTGEILQFDGFFARSEALITT